MLRSLVAACALFAASVFADYDRSEWRHWIDADGDCQDTREEVLIRDSLVPPKLTANGCKVISGLWVGWYTGKVYTEPAGNLEMEHIVSLKWAYDHGAADWSPVLKQVFANDPENLIPADLSANRRKKHYGPERWMPDENRCWFIGKWLSVTGRYRLITGDRWEC